MRSASASAAFTIDSACSAWPGAAVARGARTGCAPAGSGGSCSNANVGGAEGGLYELLIVVLVRAPDYERTGVLELADGGDDPALRLLDNAPALRRLVLHLLEEHLRAALGHVARDLLLHLVRGAAQREGEILLVDLLDHELERPVVELHD